MKELTDTKYELHPLLKDRYSPRSFDDRIVEKEKLLLLMQAVQSSPSCYNQQPWQFVIASKEEPENFERMLNTLNDKNREWAQQASVLMVSVAKLDFDHNGKPNPYAFYDVGQSTAMLLVQASSMGLYAHQMGGFDKDAVKLAFNIPQGYEPVAVTAIGYNSEEKRPLRNRKPVSSFAFVGNWKNSAFSEKAIEMESILLNNN